MLDECAVLSLTMCCHCWYELYSPGYCSGLGRGSVMAIMARCEMAIVASLLCGESRMDQ